MPESDTTVARPSSHDRASSDLDVPRLAAPSASARTLRAAVPVGSASPLSTMRTCRVSGPGSSTLHHGASVANESPSRMLWVRITTAVRHVPAFRRDPIASQSRAGSQRNFGNNELDRWIDGLRPAEVRNGWSYCHFYVAPSGRDKHSACTARYCRVASGVRRRTHRWSASALQPYRAPSMCEALASGARGHRVRRSWRALPRCFGRVRRAGCGWQTCAK